MAQPSPLEGNMIGLPRRMIRYAPLLALVVAAWLVPATPASADPVVNLNCTNNVTVEINPGITLQPQHVDLTSLGMTGTANCTGTVNGETVTGPGQISIMNQLIASCGSASGQGEFVLSVPTTSGTALCGDLPPASSGWMRMVEGRRGRPERRRRPDR